MTLVTITQCSGSTAAFASRHYAPVAENKKVQWSAPLCSWRLFFFQEHFSSRVSFTMPDTSFLQHFGFFLLHRRRWVGQWRPALCFYLLMTHHVGEVSYPYYLYLGVFYSSFIQGYNIFELLICVLQTKKWVNGLSHNLHSF